MNKKALEEKYPYELVEVVVETAMLIELGTELTDSIKLIERLLEKKLTRKKYRVVRAFYLFSKRSNKSSKCSGTLVEKFLKTIHKGDKDDYSWSFVKSLDDWEYSCFKVKG